MLSGGAGCTAADRHRQPQPMDDRRAAAPALKMTMTGIQIDRSRLPPVQEVCRDFAILEDGAFAYCLQEQEIEQHYASNVQRNQLVQKDIRIAKTLQDMEDQVSRLRVSRKQKPSEESGSKTAHAIREETQRRSAEGHRRKQTDQELARRLQEEEKATRQQQEEKLQSLQERPDNRIGPLAWLVEEENLQSQEQLRQDEELAWRLQEEEHARATRARRNRERNDDYRAAHLAQDEEIARYMQDQELKARWRSTTQESADEREGGEEVPGGRTEPRWSHHHGHEDEEPRPNGGRAAPPVGRVHPLERSETPTRGGPAAPTEPPQLCRNIVEELDPTFKAKGGAERPVALPTAARFRAATPVHPVPVDGFFDYLDELAGPAFVSPTKRQPEKAGHPKPRDKKEGCKQQ
nr:coiled-coil domain-containing protein 50-like [Pogona vitticeps]